VKENLPPSRDVLLKEGAVDVRLERDADLEIKEKKSLGAKILDAVGLGEKKE